MRKNLPRLIWKGELAYMVISRNVGGKTVKEYLKSFGRLTKTEGKKKSAEFLAQWDTRYNTVHKMFSDVVEEVRKTIEGRPKGTIQSFDIQTRHAMALWKYRPIDDILYRDIEGFKQYLRNDRDLGNSSINVAINEIRRVFKHAVRMGYIRQMPIIDRVAKPTSYNNDALPTHKIKIALKTANYETQFYIIFMLATGLRPKEFADSHLEDVDLENRRMWVHNIRKNKNRGMDTGGRYIPLSDQAQKLLINHFREGNEWLYPWATFEGAKKALQKLTKLSGIKIMPYSLRRTYATEAANRGVPRDVLAERMGTSPKMLDIHYVKENVERIRIADQNAPDWGIDLVDSSPGNRAKYRVNSGTEK